MVIPKPKKALIIEELKNTIKNSPYLIFLNILEVKTSDFNSLKSEIKKSEGKIKVVKKTLFKKALEENNIKEFDPEKYKFNFAVVFSKKEPIEILKILIDFAKNILKKDVKEFIKGGFESKNLKDQEFFIEISKLPSREVLIGKLLYVLKSPIYKLNFDLKLLGGLLLTNSLKLISQKKK